MNIALDSKIKKQGVINGLLLGVIQFALAVLSFYFMISIAQSAVLITAGATIFSYVLPLISAVILCFSLRKKIGGLWTMRQATTGIFIMFLVSYLVLFISRDQIFARVIEPNMVQKTEQAMTNALIKLKADKGVNGKEVDQKISDLKKELRSGENVSIGRQIQSFGITIIFLFVLSLIFAAFFKREGVASSSQPQ
jgi:hypothetical protein